MRAQDHEHFGRIAHLLTPSRRAVLDALAACGPMTTADIAACWQQREPQLRPLVVRKLPSMVSQSLWKLENLQLVRRDGDIVHLTERGKQAVADAPPDASA